MKKSRRDFIRNGFLAGGGLIFSRFSLNLSSLQSAGKPLVIASANGLEAASKAMQMIRSGTDPLDAVIAGVQIVEDDPDDTSVGYGGLPNEEGVVELDACVMHGPTCRGAGVASLRNIRHPSKVAKVIMERTDHVLMVGDGALKFARAHGFREENLLTDKAREFWLHWKENLSSQDDWLTPHSIDDKGIGSLFKPFYRHHGTINCLGIDEKGNIAGVTTTSGLAFKIPGRVGDSPILGAGLYVDNGVGAAGSTGRGEANLLSCSSVMIVEWMRQGKSPEEACLLACRRITDQTKAARLLNEDRAPKFDVKFYALNKRSEYGCASIWSGAQFAVHDGVKTELKDGAYLFKRKKS